MIICFLFIRGTNDANACWALLTIDELADQSEFIVIGKYNGIKRENIDSSGMGSRYWTIDVEYVLKGEEVQVIEVVTAGSSKAQVSTSIDYELTDYAKDYMLLYLTKNQEGTYVPLTPRGIVSLNLVEEGQILGTYNVDSAQYIKGEDEELVKSLEDMTSIKIEKSPIVLQETENSVLTGNQVEREELEAQETDELLIIGIGAVLGLVVLSITVIVIRKSTNIKANNRK